jgi:hypothetical protein
MGLRSMSVLIFLFLTPTLSLVGSREGESQVLKRFCLKGASWIFRPLRIEDVATEMLRNLEKVFDIQIQVVESIL